MIAVVVIVLCFVAIFAPTAIVWGPKLVDRLAPVDIAPALARSHAALTAWNGEHNVYKARGAHAARVVEARADLVVEPTRENLAKLEYATTELERRCLLIADAKRFGLGVFL